VIDIHIAAWPNTPPHEHVVKATTPGMEAWARSLGWDWSAGTLKQELTGRRVGFEGWLLFDSSHAMESEKVGLGVKHNWRATAWELHPVTKNEVLN